MQRYKYFAFPLVISFAVLALVVSGCTNIDTTSYFNRAEHRARLRAARVEPHASAAGGAREVPRLQPAADLPARRS